MKLARRSPSSEEPAHPIRVGCAGWSISAAQRAQFDEGGSGLARYASRLACLEINSSFHRSHRPDTYARWAATVPVGFRFSVKLPRTISHEQRLRGTGPLLDRFLDESSGLGEKLGCMLLQLPPSLALEPRTAARFFAMLRRRWSGNVACEPRHASWFGERAEDLLARYRIARVGADPAPHPGAGQPGGHRGLVYWRWHGSPRMYYSAYGEERLRAWADAFRAADGPAADSWVIFDNTAHGHASADALCLQSLVRSR